MTVSICGMPVAPGDILIGDADAVILLAPAEVDTSIAAAEARAAREDEMKKRLRAGETTLEILGLQRENSP